jgi:ELWxxDGT repeat protein
MSLSYFVKATHEDLWVTDGTVAGSHAITSLGIGSIVTDLTMIGTRLYFDVNDGIHGNELWTSDGTAAGTMLVKDIVAGSGSSDPANFTNVGGTLFFTAADPADGTELWKSDGTAAGTVLVKDINPGSGSSGAEGLANINGTLFFAASDGSSGFELFKSDGTAAGTVMVKDINPGMFDSFPESLTSVNGTLFFTAFAPGHGDELWMSDGTAAGTVQVAEIAPGPGGSSPTSLTDVNGTLFFAAFDGAHGRELWKSDGTAAGTTMVLDIDPGATGSAPSQLTNVAGTLFFTADDGVHGIELWKSDGTAAGTVMVKDILPGSGGSGPFRLINANGRLFFDADDGVHGTELWTSDGTTAGTVVVKDINPGVVPSSPFDLVNVNGMLQFYAYNGASIDLWQSDGTSAGTFVLATGEDTGTPVGFAPTFVPNDFYGNRTSGMLWRNSNGSLATWSMNGSVISASGLLMSNGTPIAPDASWSIAGISDFNGDGTADVLWRNSGGALAEWTLNGNLIASSAAPTLGGVAVTPDMSWSVAGVGDFDGDSRSDILWRRTDGSLSEWAMNGSSIISGSAVTSGGAAVTPDGSWSVAGIGDFNGDSRKDVLWRNASGETAIWLMNGSTISGGGDITSGGVTVAPDASWSVAGIGDFNHDGNADILWHNSNGSLALWLMNGSSISSSGTITSGGVAVTPDASWHIFEIGDFNGDASSDILWRNDNGTLSEWLMNGSTIVSSVQPSSNGNAITPDTSWSAQAKPTIG